MFHKFTIAANYDFAQFYNLLKKHSIQIKNIDFAKKKY